MSFCPSCGQCRKHKEGERKSAYSHYPSLENEQEVFVFEMWETLKDLESHINMPHYVAFDDRRKPLLESYEAQVYEATLCRSTNKAPRAN